jgi:hypothetical protein
LKRCILKISLDYDSAGDGSNVASIRFWIDSPDTYASGDGNAWGFKMFNTDGFANTTNFPALTATPTAAAATGLANSVIGFLQFTPNLTAAGSEVVFDQIKEKMDLKKKKRKGKKKRRRKITQ